MLKTCKSNRASVLASEREGCITAEGRAPYASLYVLISPMCGRGRIGRLPLQPHFPHLGSQPIANFFQLVKALSHRGLRVKLTTLLPLSHKPNLKLNEKKKFF